MDENKSWLVTGIVLNNLNGNVEKALDFPAPGKEHMVPEEYLRQVENTLFDEYHVIPHMDSKEHAYSMYCNCDPSVAFHENGKVVTHNAYDGREKNEWVEDAINPK